MMLFPGLMTADLGQKQAMIPKDESGSVVWTAEMAEAYGIAYRIWMVVEIFRRVWRLSKRTKAGLMPQDLKKFLFSGFRLWV